MTFQFRFERILDLKRRDEERVLERWVREDRAWKMAVLEQERLKAEAIGARDRLRSLQQQNPLPLFDIRQANAHVLELMDQLAEAQAKVRAAAQTRKEAQSAVRKATQERKTFEILREKQFALYLQEENRREQQLMDEIGSTRVFQSFSTSEPAGGVHASSNTLDL